MQEDIDVFAIAFADDHGGHFGENLVADVAFDAFFI